MTTAEQIRAIRAKTNLSQQAFADRFEIPKRSIENWESGSRIPPIYVLLMLQILVEHGWIPE